MEISGLATNEGDFRRTDLLERTGGNGFGMHSKLQTVCRELDVRLSSSSPITQYDSTEALEFLKRQQARVMKAESALRAVVQDLLPPNLSPSDLTTIEVAQVLEQIKIIYERQEQILRQKMQQQQTQPHEKGDNFSNNCNDYDSDNSVKQQSTTTTSNFPSMFFQARLPAAAPTFGFRARLSPFLVGRTLSDVPETDHESTDDTSTPQNTAEANIHHSSSSSSSSSPHSQSQRKRKSSTAAAATPAVSSSADASLSTGRKRQDAFAQLELQLKRDVRKVLLPDDGDGNYGQDIPAVAQSQIRCEQDSGHEGHLSSNDKDERLQNGNSSTGRENRTGALFTLPVPPGEMRKEESGQRTPGPSNLLYVSTLEDSPETEDDDDDDSALYCATVVADRDKNKSVIHLSDVTKPKQPSHRPSHITFVDTDEDSANNQTVLTLDDLDDGNCVLRNEDKQEHEEQHQQGEEGEAEDSTSVVSETSTETPVLDRYRLSIDSSSPYGVRVVPNERRKHHSNQRRVQANSRLQHRPLSKQLQPNPDRLLQSICENGPSLEVLSPSVSVRKPKFRKTPHPKKTNVGLNVAQVIDENSPLNVVDKVTDDKDVTPTASNNSTMWATPHTARLNHHLSVLSSGGSQSISLLISPAARPRALMPLNHGNQQQQKNVIGAKTSSTLLYAKAKLLEHQAAIKSKTCSMLRQPAAATKPNPSASFSAPFAIPPITAAEFNMAPRVVKIQVSLEEVQDAVRSINQALLLVPTAGRSAIELSESDLQEILAPLSERQCRSVAMALCHWRRMLMRRFSAASHEVPHGCQVSHHSTRSADDEELFFVVKSR